MDTHNSDIVLSVIIPTLNEESNITRVVSQFKALDGRLSYEVVIGDGGSTDSTTEIARALGAKIAVDGTPKKTVASGRNAGASQASGKIFMFCDADTELNDVRGLAKSIGEVFSDPHVVAAVPRMEVFPKEQLLKDRVFHTLFNNLLRFSIVSHMPLSRGQCQIIRASAFRAVGGYNAAQVHADDNSIFHELAKIGKLRFINDYTVYESPRRYRKVGYLKLSAIGVSSIIGQSIFKRNMLTQWERVD